MVTSKIRSAAATIAGVSIGLALGFGLAFAYAETRLVNGVHQRVVRFESDEYWPGEWDFPAPLVRHRVVGKAPHGNLLLESDAFHMGSRLGLVYAVAGAIAGIAVGFGADTRKVIAAGVIGAVVFSVVFLIADKMMSIFTSPAAEFPAVAMIILLALSLAWMEAVYSASGMTPEPSTEDALRPMSELS